MICGRCQNWAATVATVRACFDGATFPCGWLMEAGRDEDGQMVVVECGAHASITADGWTCEGGHEHVTAEARRDQGWDYAEDRDEAFGLFKAGVEPRHMDGKVWI